MHWSVRSLSVGTFEEPGPAVTAAGAPIVGSAGSVPSGEPTEKHPRFRTADASGATTRVAAATPADKAPKDSYERAPKGALALRDYSATRLDAERARDLVNAYRREKGLKPLKLQPALTEAAREHSRDLARWDRISHFGSDGSNPWDRVKRAGYSARLAAENVGTGQVTIDEVMKGWQASPGHNRNLLLPEAEHMALWKAAHGVAKQIKGRLNCKRVCVTVIGFEVPHAHIHLLPANSMAELPWRRGDPAKPEDLAALAAKLRG